MSEVTVTLTFTVEEMYRCTECEEVTDSPQEGPVYECPECSTRFLADVGGGRGNLCPNDNKSSGRVEDKGAAVCPEDGCHYGMDKVDLIHFDGEWVDAEDIEGKVQEACGQ